MGLSSWSKGKKASNPGPGRYDVPAPFGGGPKYTLKGRIKEKEPDPEPPIRSMSSTLSKKGSSFGYTAYAAKEYVTPGPEFTPKPFGSDGKKVNFRFKQAEKADENPGPAEYTIDRKLQPTPIAIGEGKRWDAVDPNSYSSPFDHPVPRSCPEEFPRKIGNFIPRPQPKRYGPGPAKYNMEINVVASCTPIGIHEGERGVKPEELPGPADYQRIREMRNETAIPIGMKGRPPLPHGDICDYPYHMIPGTIKPKKISFGVRPETDYKTVGPGPDYKAPSTLSKDERSIGSKLRFEDPHENVPGPGAYFKMPISEKPKSFSGILGPDTRSPINEKETSKYPGPGDYFPTRTLDKFERGFYFTSRTLKDYTPDTDAPFHDVESTLGGPKFTIGQKEYF